MPPVFATPAGIASQQKRSRDIRLHEGMVKSLKLPTISIFNVSKTPYFNRIGAGRGYTIPACEPGERYSEALKIPALVYSEKDIADGNNTMGTIPNPGIAGVLDINGEDTHVIGIANDILGTHSSSPGLGITTTNLEWMGCFATMNEVPTEAELADANYKRRQRLELIYAQGAELVQHGATISTGDRALYNETAEELGRKRFFGSVEHTKGKCPECLEDINEGAMFCKNCQQAIDPASVAARAKKRATDAAKMMKAAAKQAPEEDHQEMGE